MTGDIEAAGDLVSGALMARAVEGPGGYRDGHAALCLNCGTRLIGPHCHRCGQSGHVHRTVGAIGHEIAHGVFHLEGKIWRTVPMLVLHPGKLTRRYIDGERVRFVSPLALFLFTVFLLFATISWIGADLKLDGAPGGRERARAGLEAEIARARTALTAEEAKHDPGAPARIAEAHRSLAALEATRSGLADPARMVTQASVTTGWPRLDEGIRHAQANPNLALYRLQSSAYKYSWLLIPLSTPFVALLFLWRRRFGLYDHAVFVTYSLAFMMMLTVVLTLLGAAGVPPQPIGSAAVMIPPIHLYVQLRGTYSLRVFSALWRTALLLGFCFTVLTGFALLLLLHGLTE